MSSKIAYALCLIALVLITACTFGYVRSLSAQSLVITPSSLSLGRVPAGEIVTRILRIRNMTTHTIRISRIITSCGCTTASAAASIPAGASVPLSITFDSTWRYGHNKKVIWISTDDGPSAQLAVPMTCDVFAGAAAQPRSLSFGEQLPSRRIPCKLTLWRFDGQPLRSAKVTGNGVSDFRFARISNTSLRAIGSLRTNDQPGNYSSTLTVHVNSPSLPDIIVPITYTIPAVYHLTRDRFNFGIIRSGSYAHATITLQGPQVTAISLISAPDSTTVRLSPIRSDVLRVSVGYQPRVTRPSYLDGSISLRTQDPRQKRIVIPIYAAVEAQQKGSAQVER